MIAEKTLVVVGGATASGKTTLAIELAEHFATVVLSADSRQFYREMRIGTARPTAVELARVPHYFIANRSIHEPLSAGAYARAALSLLDECFREHNTVVLAGGSGLYIQAVCEGLDQFPTVTPQAREQVEAVFATRGLRGLQETLREADPSYYQEVDLQNPARLRRALEVCWSGDQAYSTYRNAPKVKRPFRCCYLRTDWPREILYQRINQRVDLMVAAGLEAEARSLATFQQLPVLQTVGYQEWFPYFQGEYDRDRAIELIKRNSRRYAKRQLTWFRRADHWQVVKEGNITAALEVLEP